MRGHQETRVQSDLAKGRMAVLFTSRGGECIRLSRAPSRHIHPQRQANNALMRGCVTMSRQMSHQKCPFVWSGSIPPSNAWFVGPTFGMGDYVGKNSLQTKIQSARPVGTSRQIGEILLLHGFKGFVTRKFCSHLDTKPQTRFLT